MSRCKFGAKVCEAVHVLLWLYASLVEISDLFILRAWVNWVCHVASRYNINVENYELAVKIAGRRFLGVLKCEA